MSYTTKEKFKFLLNWQEEVEASTIDADSAREFAADLKVLDEDYHTFLIEFFDEEITGSYIAQHWTIQSEQHRLIKSKLELDTAIITAVERLIENLLDDEYYGWGRGDE